MNRDKTQPKLGPTADRCRKNSRSCIMRNQEWDTAATELDTLDLAQLVLGLLGLDAVDGETALGVVDEAEVLAGLLDGDDVHEAGREADVGAHLAVNLDQSLHDDRPGLAVVERILEAVADEDDQGQALAKLMRTRGRLGGVGTRQFVEEPVRGGGKPLLVLLCWMREFRSAGALRLLFVMVRGEARAELSPTPASADDISRDDR